jgi:hypothetical protein
MARYSRVVALAKIETTYGTDSVPTGTNAVLMRSVDLVPHEADQVERTMVLPWLGNRPVALVGQRARLQGSVNLAGGGAAGNVPNYGPLLRACGLAQTATVDTRVDYTPVSVAEDSVTCYVHPDGKLHALLGTRGTFSLAFQGAEMPVATFDLTGIYVTPTAVALPAAGTNGYNTSIPLNQANTPTCTLNGQAVALRSFTYTHGNSMQVRDLPGARAVRIANRAPSATITIQDPDALTPNFFSSIGATVAFNLVHGTSAGNIVEVTLGQARLLNPRYSDDDNDRMLSFDLRPEPTTAGNDEFLLRIR